MTLILLAERKLNKAMRIEKTALKLLAFREEKEYLVTLKIRKIEQKSRKPKFALINKALLKSRNAWKK